MSFDASSTCTSVFCNLQAVVTVVTRKQCLLTGVSMHVTQLKGT